jgi:hypothetical protein
MAVKGKILTLAPRKLDVPARQRLGSPEIAPQQSLPAHLGTVASVVPATSSAEATQGSLRSPRYNFEGLSDLPPYPTGASVAKCDVGKIEVISPGKFARVREYADEFRAHSRGAIGAVLKMAQCCARANAALTHSEKDELLNELALTAASFSKLVKIASDPRLQVPRIQQRLPPGWTVMYEIASLNTGDLNSAIAEGVVHPNMTRSSLKKWLGSRPGAGSSQPGSPVAEKQGVEKAETLTKGAALGDALVIETGRSKVDVNLTVHREKPPTVQDLDELPPTLDRRPLSSEDQRAFDAIEAAWHAARELVQERFKSAYGFTVRN